MGSSPLSNPCVPWRCWPAPPRCASGRPRGGGLGPPMHLRRQPPGLRSPWTTRTESAGQKRSEGLYDPYEWRVKRSVSTLVADLAAQATDGDAHACRRSRRPRRRRELKSLGDKEPGRWPPRWRR